MNPVPITENLQKHINWLISGPVRLSDGMLAAWTDNGTPSYAYEESTGYLISLLCRLNKFTGNKVYREEAERAVIALTNSIGDKKGAGRDDVTYLFDTAVCLRAIECFLSAFDKSADEMTTEVKKLASDLAATAMNMLRTKSATAGNSGVNASDIWSAQFNIHLIKALEHLAPWIASVDDKKIVFDAVEQLASEKYQGGFFHVDDACSDIYVHPNCYAIEGLLGLDARYDSKWTSKIGEASEALAHIQLENGGIPCRIPEPKGDQPASDSTAQAIRIWQCVAPEVFGENIRSGIRFLMANQAENGGIRYCPGSSHINSWTTIFTVQALLWENTGGNAKWLI